MTEIDPASVNEDEPPISAGRRLIESMPLALGLAAFWVILSGKLDAFHLSAGAAASLGVAWMSHPLLALRPLIGAEGKPPIAAIPWGGLFRYLPWLLWQILLASVQVAYVVLHPRLPIRPRMIRFEHPLPHNLGRLLLANSITLTPGTVTIDVDENTYLVHALTAESARSLLPEGGQTMQRWASRVCGSQEAGGH